MRNYNYTEPSLANLLCIHFLTDLENFPPVKLNSSEWPPKQCRKLLRVFYMPLPLRLKCALESLEVIHRFCAESPFPTPRISDSVGLGWSPRVAFRTSFPDAAAGLRIAVWEAHSCCCLFLMIFRIWVTWVDMQGNEICKKTFFSGSSVQTGPFYFCFLETSQKLSWIISDPVGQWNGEETFLFDCF